MGALLSLCMPRGGGGAAAGAGPANGGYVVLSPARKGEGVRLGDHGRTASGGGAVLATGPLVQNKSYHEITVVEPGTFAVGCARRGADLSQPLGATGDSWALRSDMANWHDGKSADNTTDGAAEFQAGDVIGVLFDQSVKPTLTFFRNGNELSLPIMGIKGEVSAAVSVGDGAFLRANFGVSSFEYGPSGVEGVLQEQSVI